MKLEEDTDLTEVVQVVLEGGLIVYPTDTLYALGCDPRCENAVAALRRLKGKESGTPISVAFDSIERALAWTEPSMELRRIAERYLPGPVTLVVQASDRAPPGILHEGAIGIRVPDDPMVQRLLRACGPLTATSANLHGEPPPSSLIEVSEKILEGVEISLDGGSTRCSMPSTVLRLSERGVEVLRIGALPLEAGND
ncbi:MAG: L-threonylcarbamoyladenylate synthase [Candidatus Thermoplasmatota archaeon]